MCWMRLNRNLTLTLPATNLPPKYFVQKCTKSHGGRFMPGEKEPQWGRGLATGFEMAVGVALGFFVGQWLGKKYGWEPWASLIGSMLGLIAGAYLLIREVNRDYKK